MKTLVLVLLLAMGSSGSPAKYLEDSSERLSRHSDDDNEEAKDERDTPNEEEEEDEENDAGMEEEDGEEEEENSDAGEELNEREEVVKIPPGQSSRETEEEDEDEHQNADFEDTEDHDLPAQHDLPDNRMMDGDEGEKALADQENVAEEGRLNNFKQKLEEISKENENIQAQMNELEARFDKALSSDAVPGLAEKVKPVAEHDASNSDQKVTKANINTSKDLDHSRVQHSREDNLARQYSEIGEDGNADPDDDY